jgi:hypothetical protein
MKWSFIESVNMSLEYLEVGLETFEKVKRQLKSDIPRSNIVFNGENVKCVDQIIDNDINVLRCCTQAVFVKPLEHLMKVFPHVYLTHENNKDGVNIIVNVKKYREFFGFIITNNINDFTISTSFSALRKNDMKHCFDIKMQYMFNFEIKVGTLVFQVIK